MRPKMQGISDDITHKRDERRAGTRINRAKVEEIGNREL